MDDICTYRIEVWGYVDEQELSATSPLEVTVEAGPASSRFTVCTDQAGLVGLMRWLHGRGFRLLTITCETRPALVPQPGKD
jgi:hypothetical protein